MMGGGGQPLATLDTAGDLVGLLRLVSKPDGLAKMLATIEAAHKAARDDIAAQEKSSQAAIDSRQAELAQIEEAIQARLADVSGREANVVAQQTKLTGQLHQVTDEIAALAPREVALQAAEAELAKQTGAHSWEKEAHDRQYAERLATLEAEYQAKTAALDARTQRLESEHRARTIAADESDRKFAADRLAWNDRMAAIDARETDADKRREEADAMALEYTRKLASLRALVGG